MSSVFGRVFRVSTWGESHGSAVGCVLDGCPSNLELAVEDVQRELDRRRPGQSTVTTERTEGDSVRILSGLFEGLTLGTPISMIVENRDVDSSKYVPLKSKPRPSHADYTYRVKYGHVDWRGGGRSSARETVGRVAAGAVAKKLLGEYGVDVVGYTSQIGGVVSGETLDSGMRGVADLIDSNPVRALDSDKSKDMEDEISVAKKQGDSVGGVVECVALNLPAGLGGPVFDKINADLGKAVLSIPACKGVEFGGGFQMASGRGSEFNDEFMMEGGEVKTRTNHSGGVQGGITNGMPLVLRAVFKPTASISQVQKTVDLSTGGETEVGVEGRHDPCIVPRAVPVVEAMVRLVIADHMRVRGLIPEDLGLE